MWNDFICELRKLLAQRKNYVVFGGLVLVMLLCMLVVHSATNGGYQQRMMRDAGTTLASMLDGMYYTRLVMIPMHLMILPIFICTVAGDLVAGEMQEGCLKLYAARPRSRFSILFCKILAMLVFTLLVCGAAGAFTLGAGTLLYGWPGTQLVILDPRTAGSDFSILSADEATLRLGVDLVYRVFALMALGSLTLFFSCIFKRMTTATVTGITIYFACHCVGLLPQAEEIKPYLMTTAMNNDVFLWLTTVPWQRVVCDFGHLLVYVVVFCGLSLAAFVYRDLA